MNQLDLATLRQYLQDFDFHSLFLEFGWDNRKNERKQLHEIYHDQEDYLFNIQPIVNLKGVKVLEITSAESHLIPKKAIRTKLIEELYSSQGEGIYIFLDQDRTESLWVWRKSVHQKISYKEHVYIKNQNTSAFLAKISGISFSMAEIENNQPTLYDVIDKLFKSLDIDKVTKKFYDLFKKEHDAFFKFIDGIPNEDDQQWYASVVINRIMFIYFLQKKVFLNQDINYLSTKLTEFKDHDYYNDFLIKLFFDGFAKKETDRSEEIKNLIGKIPYLNGGLFIPHQIEIENQNISIQNQAFERLFKFLNQYDWILDDREIAKENEINPDVLGYIFEKYINQKQMGAYYTKEDITDYISKNCIIPNIFDQLNLDASIFDLMSDDPDRYIHDSIKHGTNLYLPTLSNQSVDLNKTASEEFALPTEIWREVIARRNRYAELKNLIINNKIYKINDLITYNLDIKLFTHDVIQRLDESQLQNLWTILNNQKILDPTCGSGAFLFAGLNILYPLYEQVAKRLNLNLTRYALIKSIIINNLYGVDIMHEAVEIAKLRLFLKLVSQVDFVENLEPLPDIDFNIRAGNTLIGYATFDEIERSIKKVNMQTKKQDEILLLNASQFESIQKATKNCGVLFNEFQRQQTIDSKRLLQEALTILDSELNSYIAQDYDNQNADENCRKSWLSENKPFHWIVEFYSILTQGGFDVIVGNPPYVEYNKAKFQYKIRGYKTESCGNLYAFVMERSLNLLKMPSRPKHFTNIGIDNIGFSNIGNENKGNYNTGNCNTGNHNLGNYNQGDYNQGDYNQGSFNIGCHNKGIGLIGHFLEQTPEESEKMLKYFQNKMKKNQTASGRCGMIVPMSGTVTPRMKKLQDLLSNYANWISYYAGDSNPGQLFDGVKAQLSIVLTYSDTETFLFTSKYNRWFSVERNHLFTSTLYYQQNSNKSDNILKLQNPIECRILEKLNYHSSLYDQQIFDTNNDNKIYYKNAGNAYYRMFYTFVPLTKENGVEKFSSTLNQLNVKFNPKIFMSIFSSNLFNWWWFITSDCYHLTLKEIHNFKFSFDRLNNVVSNELLKYGSILENDYKSNSIIKTTSYQTKGTIEYQEFYPRKSKHIIDEIDRILAQHYGFTDEELNYIINYDIKYRMGKDDSNE